MTKVALVTGGSLGIGHAIVRKFSDEGYRVFNLDLHPREIVYKDVEYIHCDVTSLDSIHKAINQVIHLAGLIDIVVANAGKHYSGTIEETSEETFYEIVNINLKGTFFLLAAVLPFMKAQNHGAIVLMSSDQNFIGKANSAIYGATKAAIGQLAKSTAIDYGKYNICINAVCPGSIDTPLYRNAISNYSKKTGIPLAEIEKEEAKANVLNRVGQASEVADLVYFLTGPHAKFITGSVFSIDGGYTAK